MKHDFTNDISCYLARLQATIGKLDKNEINTFINLLIEARDQDRQIFIMGNGGSAATASHYCCDFNKGASYGYDKRFKFICLNDNVAGMMAYANDVSYDDVFVEQLKNFYQNGDIVIGISGSGNSKKIHIVRKIRSKQRRFLFKSTFVLQTEEKVLYLNSIKAAPQPY